MWKTQSGLSVVALAVSYSLGAHWVLLALLVVSAVLSAFIVGVYWERETK